MKRPPTDVHVLRGKVALVTGGAVGIGRACAIALGNAGAHVVVADVNDAEAHVTTGMVRAAGGTASIIHTDVTHDVDVARAVELTVRAHGRLDCAVNNAGVTHESVRTAELETEDVQHVVSVNITGLWRCIREELKQMLRQGDGVIVNQASALAFVGAYSSAAYAASKHAVLGLTRSTAVEYIKDGIRVNAVCAGPVRTGMLDRFLGTDPQAGERLRAAVPIGRLAEPEEVAQAVLWLCSPASSYVVGHGLIVDGGWTAR